MKFTAAILALAAAQYGQTNDDGVKQHAKELFVQKTARPPRSPPLASRTTRTPTSRAALTPRSTRPIAFTSPLPAPLPSPPRPPPPPWVPLARSTRAPSPSPSPLAGLVPVLPSTTATSGSASSPRPASPSRRP